MDVARLAIQFEEGDLIDSSCGRSSAYKLILFFFFSSVHVSVIYISGL